MHLDLRGYRKALADGKLKQIPIQWQIQRYSTFLEHGGLGRETLTYTPSRWRDETIQEWTHRMKVERSCPTQ
jgi:hypothetical protein